MKKRWIRIVRNIIIAGVIALIPLTGFQYFWRYNAVSVRDDSGATGNKHEPNAWNANMEEGFSWVRMDDNGYNNLAEKQGEIDILLMGSSHLDGLQVGADQNCGNVLNQLLPEEYTLFHTINLCGIFKRK